MVMGYLQRKGVIYYPCRNLREIEYNEYLNERDQLLGWSSSGNRNILYSGNYDKSNSRVIPAFPDPDKASSCVSLYGDSYTYGAMVNDNDAWGNVLSTLLGCRVANYGVIAYGTDQSYLFFRKNKNDLSRVVILGYLSENILRNVNQYRPLLYCNAAKEKFALKPRFIINNSGKLELVPLLKINYRDFLQLLESPGKYLKYEYFMPGGNAGIYKKSFPYAFSLSKVLSGNFHIKAKLQGVPWYAEFYDIKHPSNALAVTFNIMRQFYIDADNLQRKPVILIIPTVLDLEYYQKNKKWPYESLKYMLSNGKIEFIDAGPGFMEYLGGRNPNVLFVARHHFNSDGERVLAGIVYAYFKNSGIILQK